LIDTLNNFITTGMSVESYTDVGMVVFPSAVGIMERLKGQHITITLQLLFELYRKAMLIVNGVAEHLFQVFT
jgi:hypothetical protein